MDIEQIAGKMRQECLAADRDHLIYNDFQKALGNLRDTPLYRMFLAMPKGILMHGQATFDARVSLGQAFESDDTFVFLEDETPEYRYLQLAHKAYFPDQTPPAGWKSLKRALAGDPALKDKIFKACTSAKEDIDENIWPKFEAIFDRYKAINNYKPFFINLYTQTFCNMAEEGLLGADMRFISQTIFDEDGHRLTDDEYVDTVLEIVDDVHMRFPYFHVNLIYSYYKGVPLVTMGPRLAHARHLQERYPDVFIGFDMVGDEDCGKDLAYYAPALKDAGVPVIMHAGESIDPSNRNVEYALDLGIKRLGHGMNLYRYPDVEARAKAEGVMLEVCPLSNQLLGYVPDLRNHPAAGYIKRGLNVTISSDDCAIFDTTYLTDDLLLAYLCWDISMEDIRRCIVNSLQGDAAMLKLFEERWQEFLDFVYIWGSNSQ